MPEWIEPHVIEPRDFRCGHCGNQVASERGYSARYVGAIYICPRCTEPTYITPTRQIPSVPYGDAVRQLPPDVEALYAEARGVLAAGAPTSSVMAARKLLMHVAVEKGAPPGQKFVEYVNYLGDKGYIPPDGKGWVDHIRNKGNEANHEIKLMTPADAKELLDFLEMLLKFVYEFPSRVPKPS